MSWLYYFVLVYIWGFLKCVLLIEVNGCIIEVIYKAIISKYQCRK